MNKHRVFWVGLIALLGFAFIIPNLFVSTVEAGRARPAQAANAESPDPSLEKDVRSTAGAATRKTPSATQAKILRALQASAGGALDVRYNNLTGTPRALLSRAGY